MKKTGFTLIELLTVIFILGVLASVVVVNVSSARVKARDDRRKIDIDTVAQSLELYYAQNKSYPVGVGPTCQIGFSADGGYAIGCYQGLSTILIPNFITALPQDPVHSDSSGYPNGDYYAYFLDGAKKKYALDAKLERNPTTFDPSITCNVPADSVQEGTFYKSGIAKCGGTYHYRRAGR